MEADSETRPREITPVAFATYSAPIMDAIRRSASAIRAYLDTGPTRLSGRLRPAHVALQMRQRPAAVDSFLSLGQPLFGTRT